MPMGTRKTRLIISINLACKKFPSVQSPKLTNIKNRNGTKPLQGKSKFGPFYLIGLIQMLRKRTS